MQGVVDCLPVLTPPLRPLPAAKQEIVFIGAAMDREAIERQLDSALLTDAGAAVGEREGRGGPWVQCSWVQCSCGAGQVHTHLKPATVGLLPVLPGQGADSGACGWLGVSAAVLPFTCVVLRRALPTCSAGAWPRQALQPHFLCMHAMQLSASLTDRLFAVIPAEMEQYRANYAKQPDPPHPRAPGQQQEAAA